MRYLDAYCQSLEDCKIGCSECGWALRAALPGANDTDYSCFGLHSVDSSARPQGPVPFDDMVRLFEQGMANFTQVTPLLDQSTMLYADNADTYLERFAADGVPHLVGEWYSESGLHMYSIVAHVPSTIGNLEIVTRQISDTRAREAAMRLDHARLPDSAFAIAGVNLSAPFSPSHFLYPLAISKVTSKMDDIVDFYEDILLATEVQYKHVNQSWGRSYKLWEANIVIRFVEAPDSVLVRNIENIKKRTHNSAYVSPWCGTDRYYDNHYAFSPPWSADNMSMTAIASRARQHQTRWHCENEAIYLFEPTGDTVYMTESTNITQKHTKSIEHEHDPTVVEDLAFCSRWSTNQAALCTQGYCTGTSVETIHTDDCTT